MSNYPPGVTDNDPHFDLPDAHEDDNEECWECAACGALLSSDMVDGLTGHRRVDDDGFGNPVEVHCGPCYPKVQEQEAKQ